jgi:hypothetical protein
MKRMFLTVAVGVAFTLSSVNCGGGSGSLTKAQFTQKANEACAEAVKQEKARAAHGTVGITEGFADYSRLKAQSMKTIKPPSELNAQYTEYMSVMGAKIRALEQYVAATRANTSTQAILARAVPLQRREETLGVALGLRSCLDRNLDPRHRG